MKKNRIKRGGLFTRKRIGRGMIVRFQGFRRVITSSFNVNHHILPDEQVTWHPFASL